MCLLIISSIVVVELGDSPSTVKVSVTHQQNGLVSEKPQGRVSSGHVVGTILQQEASEPMLTPAQAAATSTLSFLFSPQHITTYNNFMMKDFLILWGLDG